jgi:hypothetical protein
MRLDFRQRKEVTDQEIVLCFQRVVSKPAMADLRMRRMRSRSKIEARVGFKQRAGGDAN